MARSIEIGTADYVVVGAGSAGCVLANRLSESGTHEVALLEYGGSDIGPFIQMPAALSYPMNMKRYDWGYRSEPEPHLGGRELAAPRGKVLGGSSSINGLVYIRGNAKDFDGWAEKGAEGWSGRHVKPYFRRLENVEGADPAIRGTDGPMHVTVPKQQHPLDQAFMAAAQEAGFQRTQDCNGLHQDGFGPMDQTIWKGRRWSAANAYLKPALGRDNLTLYRGLACRILWKGDKATGVELLHKGKRRLLLARKEVILSASVFNSAKLLMLSGVGAPEELTPFGIDTVSERRGVGKNLQDHLEIYLQMRCTEPITLRRYMNPFSKGLAGLQWLLTQTGIGASNHFETAGFVRLDEAAEYPDAQYHFLPAAIRYDGSQPVRAHGFQAHIGPGRTTARGHVRLRSADPLAAPSIQFNYMSSEADWKAFRACVRLTREIFSQPALKAYGGGEIAPGADCMSDDDVDAFVAQEVESAYHPCGTCRMGSPDDPEAVVDPECRVIGVEGLRVVDSSVFPNITNGNINAPTLMLAEKAADHILGKTPLPADPA
ncbi:choline dehydrogenase [Henriciella aquimarina]|uniref:choline dehydrogenase n=1 Tax=Henriciella aquimarina TaxID=545261 RepID=UPI0009FDC54B|nr:choline dehydrogenase [Henriciella aquimarina]